MSSAAGDPARQRAGRPAPGSTQRPQPRYRHHAGTEPAPHGARDRPERRCQPALRIPAALRSEWQTGTARQVRFMPPGGGHDRHRTIPHTAR